MEVKWLTQLFSKWRIGLIVLTVLVVAGTIHFTSFSRPYFTLGEALFRDMMAPVQRLVMKAHVTVQSTITSLSELRTTYQRNAELEEKVINLEQQLVKLAEYQRENRWLREALEFKDNVDHTLLVAEVIGRAPSNWLSSLTINRGSQHGIEPGMAVVSGSGIIGIVENVTYYTASVVLAIDPQSAVGGLIQSTGDLILVEGDPEHGGSLIGKPLSKGVKPEPGDLIVTSGLSRTFPKGLPIGKVTQVIPGRYEMTVTTQIEPLVDFARLEYVFVVLDE